MRKAVRFMPRFTIPFPDLVKKPNSEREEASTNSAYNSRPTVYSYGSHGRCTSSAVTHASANRGVVVSTSGCRRGNWGMSTARRGVGCARAKGVRVLGFTWVVSSTYNTWIKAIYRRHVFARCGRSFNIHS